MLSIAAIDRTEADKPADKLKAALLNDKISALKGRDFTGGITPHLDIQ